MRFSAIHQLIKMFKSYEDLMGKTFDKVLEEAQEKYRMEPAPCEQQDICCRRCYQPSQEEGTGRVWFYQDGPCRGMLLIDVEFNREIVVEPASEYYFFSYYETVSGDLICNGKKEPLQPNTLYTNYPPNEEITIRFTPRTHIKGVRIIADPEDGLKDIAGGALVEMPLGDLMGVRFIMQVFPVIAQIEKCPIKQTSRMSELYYHSKIVELLSLYAGALDYGREPYDEVSMDDRERIIMLQQYIAMNLSGTVHLDELARMAHMSKSKLKYTFKAVTGHTVGEYRDTIRLQNACRMLRETDSSISTISRELGFQTCSSFSRFFRREMNTSPVGYRSTQQQSPAG